MTTLEFSDSFDTLLASYLHTLEFGEQSSQADITLDEYEKSIFLTQALDIIVKSYFESHTNSQLMGFDDSTERQIDFSNLVSYRSISADEFDTHQYTALGESGDSISKGTTLEEYFVVENNATIEDTITGDKILVVEGERNLSFNPDSSGKLILNMLSCYDANYILGNIRIEYTKLKGGSEYIYPNEVNELSYENSIYKYLIVFYISETKRGYIHMGTMDESDPHGLLSIEFTTGKKTQDTFTGRGISINLTSLKCLFILNERVIDVNDRSYVVVPLNYKEYDRISSKAYDEPLKRQAWRLFNNDENTVGVSTEIIMRSDAADFKEYKVRYVRRPRPIILVNLYDTNNSLNIDGYNTITECELNPILHNEILQMAILLVLTSRGKVALPSDNKEDRRQ